jgi:N-acetylneuraminic acid mutarotase
MTKTVALFLVFTLSVAMCMFLAKPVSAVSGDSWAARSSMHEARSDLGAAAVNGKIYAIGGYNDDSISATNEEYDPTTDKWTTKTPMPTPRYGFGITVYQNKIYCMGGKVDRHTPSAVNEAYDPATDTWETVSQMPTPRSGVEANVVGGKIYLVGGGSNATEVYDPETDHWSRKAQMPIDILPLYDSWSCASAVVDNKMYAFGLGYISGKGVAYNEIYNPDSDSWSTGAEWPSGGTFGVAGATTGVNAPKRIYVFGADALHWELTPPNIKNIIFNPEKNSWSFGTPMLTPRINVAVAAIEEVFYVIGGGTLGLKETSPASAVNEQYIPVGYYGTVHNTPAQADDVPPATTISSPENKTYNMTEIPLSFNVNESGSWMSYKLDGNTPAELDGNTTITGLISGSHSLTVSATDAAGNTGTSETVHFTVSVPEPFPTTLVIAASGAALAIVGIGLLVYFKKHKR